MAHAEREVCEAHWQRGHRGLAAEDAVDAELEPQL